MSGGLRMPLEWHNGEGIVVDLTDEGGVSLELRGETAGDLTTERSMRPCEARALASMLLHFAREGER